VGFNYLLLHSVNGHARGDITQACYTCHGRSYAGASANNVHDPGPGVSPGGVSCYACHTTYKANMEDGVGTSVGTARTSSYHHVLGGMLNGGLTYYDGDYAPGGAGAYPNTSFQQVFCVSCHVDHDKFNANKGANLQTSFGSVVATNTDRGLCLSCHGLSFSKDTTNQAGIASSATADVSTLTVTVSPTKYGLSAHDYSVNSSFGASPFNANCVKCHNDEQAKTFQTSKFQFGPHWSGARKLLASWATTVTDPLGEKHCYGCHSRAGQFGTKATNGYDAYGTAGATMTAASEYVWQNFYGSMVSSHPVSTTKLDCVNCHNTHVVRKTATQTVDPDDTYTEYAFGGSTVPSQTAFCLRCHDGAPPVYTLGAAYVPATVTVAISGGNKSAYRLTSHWEASGSVSVAERQSCAVCHDSHGSKLPKLLGAYNGTTTANTINGVAIAANDRTVCYACHANASTGFASPSDDASGYPTDGTWPGAATYTVAYSPANHTGNMHQNATWPAEPALAGGDCKVCHDVHGTANRYDELRDDKVGGIRGVYKYDPSNFSFCFNCHTAGGGSQYNIKGFFPTTASGTLDPVANPRAGHRTLSAGNLPAGSVLPCYDCHNPHGTGPNSPSGLLVVTQVGNNTTTVIGDAPGEIVMTATPAPDSVRKFCFACHTTGDSAPVLTQGWNGSAYATVTAGKVEGIDRTVYNAAGSHLKLPPVSGHYFADTASCYLCHGNDYASPGANNVHNPTGGVSGGASKCYGCHSPYKETMDAAGTSKTTVFHHTLGTGGYTGDLAPGSSNTYPTSSTTVYCVSCHTDHNYFNSNKGSNLRATIANSSGLATASSDFISGGAPSYGICISCHSAALLKDNVNQKSETTSSKTPTITGAAFDISPHDYEATSVPQRRAAPVVPDLDAHLRHPLLHHAAHTGRPRLHARLRSVRRRRVLPLPQPDDRCHSRHQEGPQRQGLVQPREHGCLIAGDLRPDGQDVSAQRERLQRRPSPLRG
jgi:predicted CXXCH cytochrome family protein